MRYFYYSLTAAALLLIIVMSVQLGCDRDDSVSPSTALPTAAAVAKPDAFGYVGDQSCRACHQSEYDLWRGSHHDLAMQTASDATVLGDFNNAVFTHFGASSRFFKRDGRFFVNTTGPDGELHDYEITHTFGVTPLQQYLIPFSDGRYQALGIAWDSRSKDQGGQRWYSLYPDEAIAHDDPLHWTGPNQNWNFMCAECHSTNLRKNYDFSADTYHTEWSAINVSCEACHGPGQAHAQWAKQAGDGPYAENDSMGLAVRLKEPTEGAWAYDALTELYHREPPVQSNIQLETCARCHSRRSPIHEPYEFGRPIADTHLVQWLEPLLYHADGQILDEVYVYGSFVQSKMHHKGVRCSDCHNVHSLKTHLPGNALCSRCHIPANYDTPKHHFHERSSTGAGCTACHMPTKNYMGVDARLDHSIRIPRPDLSVSLGVPNACNQCHDDQDAQWSSDWVVKWYGDKQWSPHYGQALDAARRGLPDAQPQLLALIGDLEQPAIARAAATAMLRQYPSIQSLGVINSALGDPDPLVRIAALQSLEMLPTNQRIPLVSGLLEDSVRAVRIEAARMLAGADFNQAPPPLPELPQELPPELRRAYDRALSEYISAQAVNADRPEAHLNLGVLQTNLGDHAKAEAAYRDAMRINPNIVEPYINLADLYRLQNREAEAEQTLRQALRINPNNASAHHALGLALVRRQQITQAIQSLQKAADLAPDNTQFHYVLAVALNSTGDYAKAMIVLQHVLDVHPTDQRILQAMAAFSRDKGEYDLAIRYADKLIALSPNEPAYRRLRQELERLRSSKP